MKERPILFSGEMVRAILESRKTQTRRVVKPQPKVIHAQHADASLTTERIFRSGDQRIHCPYGQPGDRLWVRETWAASDQFGRVAYRANGEGGAWMGDGGGGRIWNHHGYIFGTEAYNRIPFDATNINTLSLLSFGGRWRPSIYMPRWASRITLELTSVRVERLQDISEADAKAEGCQIREVLHADEPLSVYSYRDQYRRLWESLHGPGSWAANPWVWVLEFQRTEPK